MAEQNLFCLCGRCSRKLRSAAARRVGNVTAILELGIVAEESCLVGLRFHS